MLYPRLSEGWKLESDGLWRGGNEKIWVNQQLNIHCITIMVNRNNVIWAFSRFRLILWPFVERMKMFVCSGALRALNSLWWMETLWFIQRRFQALSTLKWEVLWKWVRCWQTRSLSIIPSKTPLSFISFPQLLNKCAPSRTSFIATISTDSHT